VLAPALELGSVQVSGQGEPVDGSRLPAVARLFGAAVATGMAEAALDQALLAARQGEPEQMVEFKLADIRTRADSARMLVHQAAVALQRERDPLNLCREARIVAAEAAVFCAEQATAIAPGLGASRLQELVRDCRLAAAIDEPLDQERQELAALLLAV
jgi:alkylation response protein AidB-like acyl-CoA dehydrogenase